jgi:hypothetical protein
MPQSEAARLRRVVPLLERKAEFVDFLKLEARGPFRLGCFPVDRGAR